MLEIYEIFITSHVRMIEKYSFKIFYTAIQGNYIKRSFDHRGNSERYRRCIKMHFKVLSKCIFRNKNVFYVQLNYLYVKN